MRGGPPPADPHERGADGRILPSGKTAERASERDGKEGRKEGGSEIRQEKREGREEGAVGRALQTALAAGTECGSLRRRCRRRLCRAFMTESELSWATRRARAVFGRFAYRLEMNPPARVACIGYLLRPCSCSGSFEHLGPDGNRLNSTRSAIRLVLNLVNSISFRVPTEASTK